MTISSTLIGLENIAKEAAAVASALSASGIPGLSEASAIIGAATTIATNVQAAIATDSTITSTTDQAQLDALMESLLAQANQIGALVDKASAS